MTRARQFRTVERVSALRLLRARRAVEEARSMVEAAAAALARTRGRLDVLTARATAADRALRDRPQCEHRRLSQDVTRAELTAGRHALAEQEDELRSRTADLSAACLAQTREEARAEHVAGIAARDAAQLIERAVAREEEDRWTSPRAA